MVAREALWALFPQIGENSSFDFILLVFPLGGWPLPRRGLLADQHGGHGYCSLLIQKGCCCLS